jgi:hypothetical protein
MIDMTHRLDCNRRLESDARQPYKNGTARHLIFSRRFHHFQVGDEIRLARVIGYFSVNIY